MADPTSKVIRVFLSSTFVDFQEERSLLVKQVFPSLRRRARSRAVEIVDVDLRWGVTEEQTQRGETLPLCLAEIDRCRPYFIGLLGERYGWVPPPEYYRPELLERQPWLKERMGGASVTELEILHGVLRNPEMAGHALFYLRDPAYAQAQGEPGWLAENPQEQERLSALKQQVRSSGFPVVENLADPQAIAERIEADLWAVIEQRFPEEEPLDALARVDRSHAAYRQARTGLYIGGEVAIAELEGRISADQQQIVITGESGSGKSALIANWVAHHQQLAPMDVVFCHHLDCTNDASAITPMLGRFLATASPLLLEQELIQEALKVPEDWWALTSLVVTTLQNLGVWCRRSCNRWIWVLDGLDRLGVEDQQALPWLPLLLPAGVHVVVSALECPARSILEERGYSTQAIAALERPQQEVLIDRYLWRYTKQLTASLRQQILSHPQAGSPLYLRVLLEELRQCACHDTLPQQLVHYLKAGSLGGLFRLVLERLEADGHGDAVRKVLTMLWASRAGLSEEELLSVTGLAPLQWVPIDLALEQALGRTGERLVFGHAYLRQAAEARYLPTDPDRRESHSLLADWFTEREEWDERHSEELPWQLQEADRLDDLRELILNTSVLVQIAGHRGSREVVNYWLEARAEDDGELDETIADAVDQELESLIDSPEDSIKFVDTMAALLDEAGLYRKLLLRLRENSLSLENEKENKCIESEMISLARLASSNFAIGNHDKAESLYRQCLEVRERLLGGEHRSTLATICSLADVLREKGDYDQADVLYRRCLDAQKSLLGVDHPSTLSTINNFANNCWAKGSYEQAGVLYRSCLDARERLLGVEHLSTLTSVGNLGNYLWAKGDYEQAVVIYKRCLEARERMLGFEHPTTLTTVGNLAFLLRVNGDYEQAEVLYSRCLQAQQRLLGFEHPATLTTVGYLALLLRRKGDYDQSEALYGRCLKAQERLLGVEHPATLITIGNLAGLFGAMGNYSQAQALCSRCLDAQERVLGIEHPYTLATVGNLASIHMAKGNYEAAEKLYIRCLEARERLLGVDHPSTLTTVHNIVRLLRSKGDDEKVEALSSRFTELREELLGLEHTDAEHTAY